MINGTDSNQFMGTYQGSKYDEEKVPVDLLPPDPLWEVARVLEFGARKYDGWNWYKGIKYTRLYAAALRHMWQWFRGYNNDIESGLSHLAHACCCMLFLLQQIIEDRSELDNRPPFNTKNPEAGVSVDGKVRPSIETQPDNAGDIETQRETTCGGDR
jgi:hypothetical protein